MPFMIQKLKKIKRKYWIITGIVVLIIVILLVNGSSKNDYQSYTVVTGDVSNELLLAGIIDAENRVDLGFANSGRVSRSNFVAGERVRKGQIIAEISQSSLQSDLIQARANNIVTRVETENELASAEGNYETQLREQESIVEGLYQQYLSGDLQAYSVDNKDRDEVAPVISGSYLSDEEGEYTIETYNSGTSSGYSFRLSGLEGGTYSAEVNQSGKLGERGLYIRFDEDSNYGNSTWVVPIPNTRSSTYIARKTAYENAVAKKDSIIKSAENNLNKFTNEEENISRNEALRKQSEARVQAIYAQLGDGRIVAPFDGIIAQNDLIVGEMVNAYTTEVVLFGSEKKELVLNVPEIYINKVERGDTVAVTLDAYPEIEFSGTVSFIDVIDTEVNGVPVYQTTITLDNPDERIRVGMNAKARILSEKKENVVTIPQHYITIGDDGSSVVKVQNEEGIQERTVTTGLQGNDGLTEIIQGLSVGEVVVYRQN